MDSLLPPARNVALLIDADNASPSSLDPVLTVLAELGTVNIRRAYGNWKKPALNQVEKIIRHGIEPQQQFDAHKGKSATDMKMIIDAMDLIYGRVGGFGLMSSDSDHAAGGVHQAGRAAGLRVRHREDPARLSECLHAIHRRRGAGGDQYSLDSPKGSKPAVDETVVKLLGDAIKAAKRDERGFASISKGRPARRQPLLVRRAQLRLQPPFGPARSSPQLPDRTPGGGAAFVKRVR